MPKDERQQFRALVESQLDKNADRREEADVTKGVANVFWPRNSKNGRVISSSSTAGSVLPAAGA